MSILKKLRAQRTKKPVSAPVGGQTEAAARLLAAGSGKAATSPAAPISNEQEKAVQLDTQMKQDQLAQQAVTQAAGEAVQEEVITQQRELGSDKLGLQQKAQALQESEAMKDLEAKLTAAYDKLGFQKEAARADTKMFFDRMSNKEYINELQTQGMLDRAYDSAEFARAMTENAIGHETVRLMESRDMRSQMNMEARTWEERMAELDVDNFIRLAESKIKNANAQAVASGAGTAAGGVASYIGDTKARSRDQGGEE